MAFGLQIGHDRPGLYLLLCTSATAPGPWMLGLHLSQSPVVSCVWDPGHTHVDGSYHSGQDSEEGMAPGPFRAPVVLSDSQSHTAVPRLQPQQCNLFLSSSDSDS